jgi:hypothetical protein
MRNRILSRAAMLAIMVTSAAALGWSTTAFAGTPSLSSGCGSGATVVGADAAGKVTLGIGNSSCVLTFSAAFANAPACMAMNETNGGSPPVAAGVKTTPTQLTVGTSWADGDTLAYTCSSY